jgi:6-phosphogluconolactonase
MLCVYLPSLFIQRNDPINTTNCDGAKAHESVLIPVDHRAYVMDLGSNCIYQYDYGRSSTGEYLMVPSDIESTVKMSPGCGPRHMLMHPSLDRAYLVCELSSTVTVLTVDPTTRTLTPVYTLSTLRPGESSTDMAAGELQLSSNGKFLYVSNRDNSDPNQNRSSIAVFSLSADNQELIHIQNVDSHGMHPRHFTLDFTGTVLLVANQKSNNIVSFSVNVVTGLIDESSAKVFQHPDLLGPAQILLVPFLIN